MNTQITNFVKNKTDTYEAKIAHSKKKARKFFGSLKFKIVSILIGVVLSIGFFVFLLYKVNSFFEENKFVFHSPLVIKLFIPIRIEKRYSTPKKEVKRKEEALQVKILPTPTKPLTDKEIIYKQKHADVLWKIYGLESSWGKNDSCKNIGKFNGYGYASQCFDSFEEVTMKVNNWLEKQIRSGKDLATTLCYYNLGEITPNCKYFQAFLSL